MLNNKSETIKSNLINTDICLGFLWLLLAFFRFHHLALHFVRPNGTSTMNVKMTWKTKCDGYCYQKQNMTFIVIKNKMWWIMLSKLIVFHAPRLVKTSKLMVIVIIQSLETQRFVLVMWWYYVNFAESYFLNCW